MHFSGIHKHFTSHSHADFDVDVFVHSTIKVTAYSVSYISSWYRSPISLVFHLWSSISVQVLS